MIKLFFFTIFLSLFSVSSPVFLYVDAIYGFSLDPTLLCMSFPISLRSLKLRFLIRSPAGTTEKLFLPCLQLRSFLWTQSHTFVNCIFSLMGTTVYYTLKPSCGLIPLSFASYGLLEFSLRTHGFLSTLRLSFISYDVLRKHTLSFSTMFVPLLKLRSLSYPPIPLFFTSYDLSLTINHVSRTNDLRQFAAT